MRKRVGVLVPSTNTAVETELGEHLPAGTSVHTARMFFGEGENAMLDVHLPTAVRDLASMRPDAVLFACTTAGAMRGSAFESDLIRSIGEQTGAPTISIMSAVVDELNRRGVKRVGVLTPYTDHANQSIERALREAGFEVVVIAGLGITDGFAIAETTPERLIEFGREALGDKAMDSVFISCTNLFTLDHLERFEREFARPVISSMSAAMDAIERSLEPVKEPAAVG